MRIGLRARWRAGLWIAVLVSPWAAFLEARAQSESQFYAGKTVRIIVSTTPGGGYDLRARAVSRHLPKHIPGSPNVVVENMPGGGSVVAMNYVYNVAPRDGTVLLMFQRTTLTTPIMAPNGVRFDLTKFTWLGSVGKDPGLIVSWHESPITKTEDIFSKEMIIATTAQTTMPVVLNALIGTKFKIISGYPGSPEMQLAMQRGEVMGPGEWSWSDLRNSTLYQDHKLNLLLQTNLTRAPDLQNVPLATDFAKNEQDKRILEVFLAPREIAYPIVMPPDVPVSRAAAIEAAILAVGRDREFREDLRKSNVEVEMTPGRDVATIVAGTAALPADMSQRVRELMGPQ